MLQSSLIFGSAWILLVLLAERQDWREVRAIVVGDPRSEIEQRDAPFQQSVTHPWLGVCGQDNAGRCLAAKDQPAATADAVLRYEEVWQTGQTDAA